MAKMTTNSVRVFHFLQATHGARLTNKDIAEALGVSSSTVVGSVTGLCKKGLAVRTEEHLAGADGKDVVVKYISLTDEGMAFDPDATQE